jgi:hypothetical protein
MKHVSFADLIKAAENKERSKESQPKPPSPELQPVQSISDHKEKPPEVVEASIPEKIEPIRSQIGSDQSSIATVTSQVTSTSQATVAMQPLPIQKPDIISSLPDIAGYLSIPNKIIHGLFPLLTSDEQSIYLHLYSLSHGFGNTNCTVSLQKLSKRTNISPRQVQRVLDKLEDKGLVTKQGEVRGYGKQQGVIFCIATVTSQDKETSHARMTRQATVANNKDHDHDDLKRSSSKENG